MVFNKRNVIPTCKNFNLATSGSKPTYQPLDADAEGEPSGSNNIAWAIIIGPEGGFSDAELNLLRSLPNSHSIDLGPRILRAETAIITAIALWQNTYGDFNLQPDFRG